MFTKSFLYTARCPAAKHATVLTTLSKYFNLVAIDTWWSCKIQRLAKNALPTTIYLRQSSNIIFRPWRMPCQQVGQSQPCTGLRTYSLCWRKTVWTQFGDGVWELIHDSHPKCCVHGVAPNLSATILPTRKLLCWMLSSGCWLWAVTLFVVRPLGARPNLICRRVCFDLIGALCGGNGPSGDAPQTNNGSLPAHARS